MIAREAVPQMFGPLGIPEILFILVLALLIFGPRKLPEIGRTIGRGLAEFRKASTDLKRSLNAEMIEEEMRQSDPRKILEDDAVTGPAAARDNLRERRPSAASPPPAAEPAPVPDGTVARSAAGGDDASPDAAVDAVVSETVPEPEAQ